LPVGRPPDHCRAAWTLKAPIGVIAELTNPAFKPGTESTAARPNWLLHFLPDEADKMGTIG